MLTRFGVFTFLLTHLTLEPMPPLRGYVDRDLGALIRWDPAIYLFLLHHRHTIDGDEDAC